MRIFNTCLRHISAALPLARLFLSVNEIIWRSVHITVHGWWRLDIYVLVILIRSVCPGWDLRSRLSRRSNSLINMLVSTKTSLVLGSNFSRFILEIDYSMLDNGMGSCLEDMPFQSAVGGIIGGLLTVVSMKLRRTPLLHTRLDFRQFWQLGSPSSH